MLKALDLGRNDNKLAMTAILMLEEWIKALPFSISMELYKDILPKLSPYLQIDVGKRQKHKGTAESYFAELLKAGNEVQYDRHDIANKVLDLLGNIGGFAHNIINNEESKAHEKENYIKWDPERRLLFQLPLYSK